MPRLLLTMRFIGPAQCLSRILVPLISPLMSLHRVVITAAEFPDPRYLSYDLLFQRVLRHLDLYGVFDWA